MPLPRRVGGHGAALGMSVYVQCVPLCGPHFSAFVLGPEIPRPPARFCRPPIRTAATLFRLLPTGPVQTQAIKRHLTVRAAMLAASLCAAAAPI